MEQRTAESPMDFEWQSGAPGDVSSPFYQLSVQHENQKKRSHGVLESPTKSSIPSLREPNSQPFFFSQPPIQTPMPPSRSIFGGPAFMTPRKLDLDFSPGENNSSPENNDEDNNDDYNDDVTPEQPTKVRKQESTFGLYGKSAPSPGRGEIPKMNHYSNAVARRVQKRRQRDREIEKRLRGRNQRSDSSSQGGQPGKKDEQKWVDWLRSSFGDFFALLEAHPHVPSILSWWAQLAVNLALFLVAAYMIFWFMSAVRTEFDHAAEAKSEAILNEMSVCTKNYVDNKCSGKARVPALETVCENWERCMNRDPHRVGRAKLSAHTMAEIINSFIDPISWKAILLFIASLTSVSAASNWTFRAFRDRLNRQSYMHSGHNFANQQPDQHHASSMHPQSLFQQDMSGFGYFGPQQPSQALRQPSPTRAASFHDKQDEPLMIEPSPSLDYVSRERERHLRSPSPVKRGRKRL